MATRTTQRSGQVSHDRQPIVLSRVVSLLLVGSDRVLALAEVFYKAELKMRRCRTLVLEAKIYSVVFRRDRAHVAVCEVIKAEVRASFAGWHDAGV